MGREMRKTKIVATIGPACDTEDVIAALIETGMDMARLNFSHATHRDHGKKIRLIRHISAKMNRPVSILQDLAGPKIRVGKITEPGILLEPGKDFVLTSRQIIGNRHSVSVLPETPPGS